MRISDWSSDVCSSYLVEDVEDAARSGLAVERRQRDRIDAGKRHERQEAEDEQRAERAPDTVLEFGRLTEFRKVKAGRKLVGARGHGDLYASGGPRPRAPAPMRPEARLVGPAGDRTRTYRR